MSAPSLLLPEKEFEYILNPRAVRERAAKMLALCQKGGTSFRYRPDRIAATTEFVLEITRTNYPDIAKVPFHARWEHFQVGGVDRLSNLDAHLAKLDSRARARAKLDLVVVSVLLDAGAGAEWKYRDAKGAHYNRSEGLAVASLEMFLAGAFSARKGDPYRVDSEALARFTAADLAKGLQVSDENPLVGLEGRAALLQRLGAAMHRRGDFFGRSDPRPSGLLDWYAQQAEGGRLPSSTLLKGLLLGLQDMWPPRIELNGVGFGDVWSYDLGGATAFDNLVPFHKLSQWLTYSLFEPVQAFGLNVQGAAELTGLPEYRNGGLLLDQGVLEIKDPAQLAKTHRPEDPFIIEWRALTVAILDHIGKEARSVLNLSEAELPLGKILQGGTWAAGRVTAAKLRNGQPPLKIQSDGTVF